MQKNKLENEDLSRAETPTESISLLIVVFCYPGKEMKGFHFVRIFVFTFIFTLLVISKEPHAWNNEIAINVNAQEYKHHHHHHRLSVITCPCVSCIHSPILPYIWIKRLLSRGYFFSVVDEFWVD